MILLICVVVLLGFASLYFMWRYRRTKAHLSQELIEYQRLFAAASEGLVRNIFQADITRNQLVGENARAFLKNYGIHDDDTYDNLLRIFTAQEVEADFREALRARFSSRKLLAAFQAGTEQFTDEFRLTDQAQQYIWMRVTARLYTSAIDGRVYMLSLLQNIEAEKQRDRQDAAIASQDPLTGLYNQEAVERLVREELAVVSPEPALSALLLLDIDNFRKVNEKFGHDQGNEVLISVSQILVKHFRKSDIIGRLSADRYMILLKDISNSGWLKTKLNSLNARVHEQVITRPEQALTLSISIGAAVFPGAADDYHDLFAKTEQALTDAKEFGGNDNFIYGFDKYKAL